MSIVNIFQAKRGGTQGRDGNGFIYYLNRKTALHSYWLCKQPACNVRMTSLNATSELVGPAWPVHDHGINILKQKAREAQEAAVQKYAKFMDYD